MTSGVLWKRRTGTNIWDAPGRPSIGLPVRTSNYSDPSYEADATNTGPVAGTSLQVRYVSAAGALSTNPADDDYGVHTLSTANATIENLDIRGALVLTAANITVRNCIIRGRAQFTPANQSDWRATVDVQNNNAAGFHILDCEIGQVAYNPCTIGVYGDAGGTVERCNIWGCVDGLRVWNNTSLLGSWVHDLTWFEPGTYTPADGSHADAIQLPPTTYTGTAQVIQGCTLDARQIPPLNSDNDTYTSYLTLSCVMLPDDIVNLVIDNNVIRGGTWPINVGGAGAAPAGGTVLAITNNRIEPGYWVTSGTTGHIIAKASWQAIWTQTGNTDYATGGAIRVKNG